MLLRPFVDLVPCLFFPVQLLISCSVSTLFSSIFAVIVWPGNYGCSRIWGLQFLSLFVLVFRVEEWTGAQTDICTSVLFVWQVSSIRVTIEYNILTSSRRVANRLIIIVEDFCCVYCFVRGSNSPTDRQVISCRLYLLWHLSSKWICVWSKRGFIGCVTRGRAQRPRSLYCEQE